MELRLAIAKFLVGGTLVCVFALISEVFMPKRFAGLFSAAPSVLTAGLAVTLIGQSALKGLPIAIGAIAGGVGLIAYCLAATPMIRREKPLSGSSLAVLVWLIVSIGVFAFITKVVGA